MLILRMLLIALSILILTACNLGNVIKMRYANDDAFPTWPEGVTKIGLITEFKGNKPYVMASVNGKQGYIFMIDTAASMSYLFDTPKVVGLGLNKGYTLTMGGWGDGEDSEIYQTEIHSLSLNGVDFGELNMAFLPASKTKYFSRNDEITYDGVLGHDILRHFSWTFDRPNNYISISAIPYSRTGIENTLEFGTSFSKISVAGEIDFGNGQISQQEFIVDTGSRHYLKVSAAYVENKIQLSNPSIIAADFGLSGRAVHERISVNNLRIGSQNFPWVKANLIGKDDDEDENWVFGSGLFKDSKVIIDYHSSKLHIVRDDSVPFKSRYNLIGLELRKLSSGNFVVRYVFPNSPSSAFSLDPGDVVTKVNKKDARAMSQEDWLNISATEGLHQICIKSDIEKNCYSIEAEHILGYSMPNTSQ